MIFTISMILLLLGEFLLTAGVIWLFYIFIVKTIKAYKKIQEE